jgi:GTPase involved in cell partitioning and DNA repair
MIVVATKLDATTDREKLEELRKFCKKKGLEFHAISAAAGEGVKELVRGVADALDKIPKEAVDDEEAEGEDSATVGEDSDAIDVGPYEDAEESEPGEEGPPVPKNS